MVTRTGIFTAPRLGRYLFSLYGISQLDRATSYKYENHIQLDLNGVKVATAYELMTLLGFLLFRVLKKTIKSPRFYSMERYTRVITQDVDPSTHISQGNFSKKIFHLKMHKNLFSIPS